MLSCCPSLPPILRRMSVSVGAYHERDGFWPGRVFLSERWSRGMELGEGYFFSASFFWFAVRRGGLVIGGGFFERKRRGVFGLLRGLGGWVGEEEEY